MRQKSVFPFSTAGRKISGMGLSSSTCRFVLVVGCSEKSRANTTTPANPLTDSSKKSSALNVFPRRHSAMAAASDTASSKLAQASGVRGNASSASCFLPSDTTLVSFTRGRETPSQTIWAEAN